MKAMLINGSPHAGGCTATALREVEKALGSHGIETELFWIGTEPVAGCIACGQCAKSGLCVFGDKVNEIIEKLDGIDALVVGSPVYYAAASGQVTAFLDRLFYAAGERMAGKLGAAVVSCRRGGAATAFDQLNKYFTISCMPVVSASYWNQVHGSTPEEVRRDLEGMRTMRVLGENLAWLLRVIEAGRKDGVPEPVYEPQIRTNFIR